MSDDIQADTAAEPARDPEPAEPLAVGDRAPEFALKGVHDGEIRDYSLSELTEQGSVLVGFYVFDFSPICTRQMCQLTDMDWYEYKTDLSVVGVSADGPYSHMEFAEREDIKFPLLCDTDRRMARGFGVLLEEADGFREVPLRSLFLVDGDGIITYRWVADDTFEEGTDFGINPVEEAIAQL